MKPIKSGSDLHLAGRAFRPIDGGIKCKKLGRAREWRVEAIKRVLICEAKARARRDGRHLEPLR